jgi:Ca-activated chloride channel family protein
MGTTRIDDLTSQDYTNSKPEIKDAITNLGLEYRLMTQFTSFVAVEERVVTDGGQPRRIEVPVELPEGVSYEGIFGKDEEKRATGSIATPTTKGLSNIGGIAYGTGSGASYPKLKPMMRRRVNSRKG